MRFIRMFMAVSLIFSAATGFAQAMELIENTESPVSESAAPIESVKRNSGRPDGYNCWDRRDDYKNSSGFTEIPSNEIPEEFDAVVDLSDCRFGNRQKEAISVQEGACDGKAVIKLTLDPVKTEFRKAKIELIFAGSIEGHLLNIGDSSTNNGFGGDGATQSRDSEAQIVNGDFSVFGDDFAPTGEEKVLASVKGLAKPDSSVIIEIGNNFIAWKTSDGITGSVNSPFIFSLDGQEDKEGPVNHDIFIGLNQVVDGNYRSGKGLIKANIKLSH
ncbi:MAG: hypothetical protein ACOYXC_15945 [Candidatus Rifleibacteriota bacterium]